MATDLFSIGRSSLHTSKKSLSTTSHNIANANTEGYSRQVITAETNTPIANGKNIYGTGVNVQSVKRVHDNLIEKKLNESLTNNEFDKERTFQLSRVEEVFNEVNSEGMNKVLNRFFNSFRELSNQPENEVVRALVRDNAKIVVKDFKRISSTITELKKDIDTKIAASVDDLNNIASSISELNKEIVRLENAGGETGDLRDQRDEHVRQMAKSFKLSTYEDKKGQYVVNIVGAGSIIAGGVVNALKGGMVQTTTPGSYPDEGKVEIFFADKPNHIITSELADGQLGALVQTRNDELHELRGNVDEIAYSLVHSTNAIHRRGFVNKPLPVDEQGRAVASAEMGPVTNINFFAEPSSKLRAAEYIDLSSLVKEDLNNISTGLEPNSPGDNRIAIAISKLQHEKILKDGTTSFEESYLQSVGKIGLTTSKSKINTEQSSGILAQAKSIKERMSGVSLDEETSNMIRYQHAYDASARMIKTADEMFDSVLGMMR